MSPRHLSLRALLMAVGVLFVSAPGTFSGQAPAPDASERTASASELKQAEKEVPQLAEVLELSTGMTVADIGAGHGAMSIVMSRWLGPAGRLYATDISDSALKALRDAKTREHLENLVVVESGERATNLPDACCDGIFIRNVYHHITKPADFTRSLAASLRPGGRLAVLDFNPDKGSTLPNGVPKNRGGHGITPDVVEEELRAAGLVHVKTTTPWPATSKASFLVLFRRPA